MAVVGVLMAYIYSAPPPFASKRARKWAKTQRFAHKSPLSEAETEAELGLRLLRAWVQLHRAALVGGAVHLRLCDAGDHRLDPVVLRGRRGYCDCERLQERGRRCDMR